MRIDPIRLAILVGIGAILYFGLSTQYNPEFSKTILLGYLLLCYKLYETLEPVKNIGGVSST